MQYCTYSAVSVKNFMRHTNVKNVDCQQGSVEGLTLERSSF